MEPLTLQRRLRFVLEWMKGYKVYYLVMNDEVVAYSVVSRGGGRYSFATKEDIVVEEHRGNRYSEILVSELLHNEKIKYRYAWDWIRHDNIASLRCADRAGFVKVDTFNLSKPLRRIKMCKNEVGEFFLLKYQREE